MNRRMPGLPVHDQLLEFTQTHVHHRLDGHGPTPGDGEGQGSLVSCSPWGCNESDTTEHAHHHHHNSVYHMLSTQALIRLWWL